MNDQNKEQLEQKYQEYYSKLNPEQKEAVDTLDGPVITIAGAGTGKTQMLSVRIAKILQETQTNPYNILCLTFTDAGVTAMRKRLVEIIGPASYQIKICTFHGFCNEIISTYPDKFNFKRDSEQIDDLEKVKFLNEVIDELGNSSVLRPPNDHYYNQSAIERNIQELKQENFTPEKYEQVILEIEEFLGLYWPLLEKFIDIKGSPTEEVLNSFHTQFNSIKSPETPIAKIWLNYYQEAYSQYLSKLDGTKRNDGTKRTNFKRDLNNFFGECKNNLPKQKEFGKAYRAYQKKLADNSRYDYSDMILFVTQKFQQDPYFLRIFQEKYEYILVDEYQDTNTSQNITVTLLGQFFDKPNLFVVGDDDQSIYRFQGASIENIISFYKYYEKDIKIITLNKNYRSQQGVLDAATSVIKNNQTRIANFLPQIDKDLISQTGEEKEKILLYEYETEQNENYGIAKTIENLIKTGINPSEIAVLYRNHSDANDLVDLMEKLQIPFLIKAGNNILDEKEINKLLSLLRLVENPNSNELLSNCLFFDFLEINTLDLFQLFNSYSIKRLENQGLPLFRIIQNAEQLAGFGLKEPQKLVDLANKIGEWKILSSNEVITKYFETIVNESGLLKKINQSEQKLELLNRLNTLFKEIKSQARRKPKIRISEFLESIDLRIKNNLKITEEAFQTGRDAVQLMTAHASKGLEYEHVFILKCRDKNWGNQKAKNGLKLPEGIIKSYLSISKEEKMEDERRLFYVALTRAKKQIHLSFSKNRHEANKKKEDAPSIFITEINPTLIEKVNVFELENEAIINSQDLIFTPTVKDYSILEKNFLHKEIERYRMNVSGLNNYLTCPRKFLYQNLIKIPQAKHKSAAMGTAIHSSLDEYFKSYKQTGSKPPKDLLLISFKYNLEKELLSDQDYKEQLERGTKILDDYYEENNSDFNINTLTEYNFSSHNLHLDDIAITGKIDKIEILDPEVNLGQKSKIRLVDFKTGNPDSRYEDLKENGAYWRQIIFYKILCDLSTNFPYQATTGQIDFLEKSKRTKKFIKKEIPITAEAIEETKNIIRLVNQQIKNLEFEKIDLCETCDTCPFKNICWKN